MNRLQLSLGAAALLLASHAFANTCPPGNPPTNCAPPPGAILDLDGTPIPGMYQQYTVNFMANNATTNVSFAMREDPAFIFLDDLSVTLGGGPNLLSNGGFEDGVIGDNAPVGWTYLNSFGAAYAGVVDSESPRSGSNDYDDGAVQAYDGITQAIATTVGDIYTVNFWLMDDSGESTFSRISTNGDVSDTGGNGIDLLVYAGVVPTLPPVPEPPFYALMAVGLAAITWMKRRRRAR